MIIPDFAINAAKSLSLKPGCGQVHLMKIRLTLRSDNTLPGAVHPSLMLTTFSVRLRIGAFGISASAPINYEYDGPNKLYLEAYGQRLTLIRQTGEKPDDYKNLTQDGIGFEINGTEIQINDDAIEDVQEGLDGIIDGLKDSIGQ